MDDTCTYIIRLRGQLDLCEINAMSPIQMTLEKKASSGTTAISTSTDQAGLIGLLRYLHGIGFIFLSVVRTDKYKQGL